MKMKMKTSKVLLTAAMIAGLLGSALQAAAAGPVELVFGTDKIKSKLFKMGVGLSAAIALNADGVVVFNYSTKGSKDNLKRLTAKKRAINLAVVSGKALKNAKQRDKVLAVMTLGSTKKKPDWVVLVVRPKPPKGVSKARYEGAIYQLVKALTSKKTMKLMKKHWKRWAPQRNAVALKNIGVKYHAGAIKAFKEMGS